MNRGSTAPQRAMAKRAGADQMLRESGAAGPRIHDFFQARKKRRVVGVPLDDAAAKSVVTAPPDLAGAPRARSVFGLKGADTHGTDHVPASASGTPDMHQLQLSGSSPMRLKEALAAEKMQRSNATRSSPEYKQNAARFSRLGRPVRSLREIALAPHKLEAERRGTLPRIDLKSNTTQSLGEAQGVVRKSSANAPSAKDLPIVRPQVEHVRMDHEIRPSSRIQSVLAGSKASADVLYDRSRLPLKFCAVLDQMDALESAFAMLQARGARVVISSLSAMVERTTRKAFPLSCLRQLVFLMPEVFPILPARGTQNGVMDYEIALCSGQAKRSIHHRVKETMRSPTKTTGSAVIERRIRLHRRLLHLVQLAHAAHKDKKEGLHAPAIKSPGVAENIDTEADTAGSAKSSSAAGRTESGIQTWNEVHGDCAPADLSGIPAMWSAEFDLEADVPDVPQTLLEFFLTAPRIDVPKTSGAGSTTSMAMSWLTSSSAASARVASEMERKARQELHDSLQFRAATPGETPDGSGSISSTLLERVRMREKELKTGKSKAQEDRRALLLAKLVPTADAVRSLFNAEKKLVMEQRELLQKLHANPSFGIDKTSANLILDQLVLIANQCPEWMSLETSKVNPDKQLVKLCKTAQYPKVRTALAAMSNNEATTLAKQ
ncbi:hypothetical protein FVE85_7531 [Porphyridium purpureum]|uniref:CDT1 Geminin-binding domain-containing protein n=1 Tax=Porphyridium purpureum TaxID=35688 RepID=A0A5J4Z862_PORPP|nr:hypothetical protein FVE85_7531 [Porphyridium purpureum]|eukprot:POR2269..scf295_1